MSLDASIDSIMKRLTGWSEFPKYSLERRVDIFLTPYLESFIGWKLNGEAELIAPEFPLLASHKDEKPPPVGSDGWTAHTVNVDYLLYVRREGARADAWVFVELKTDGHSFRDKQDVTYWNAIGLPMGTLRGEIDRVAERTLQRHEPKYVKLREALDRVGARSDTIELAYIGPRPKRQPRPEFMEGVDPGDSRRDRVHFLSLAEFAAQPDDVVPAEHRELWPHVRGLLRAIDPEPGVRGPL